MNLIERAYQKIVRESDSLIRETGGRAGIYNQLYRNASGSRMVVYHGICKKDHTRFSPTFLEQKTFEAHLQFFRKQFNVVSLEEYFENKTSSQFTVSLSFDDGLANNLYYVLPLLEQYQLPSSFFITGAREAGYDILWNDLLCLLQKYGPATFQLFDEKFYKDNSEKYVSGNTKTLLKDFLMKDDFYKKAELIKILDPYIDKYKKKEEDYWLQMTKEEYKNSNAPTINHFYEKLLLLKGKMNTETGKKLAEQRHQFMEQYLDQFFGEAGTYIQK